MGENKPTIISTYFSEDEWLCCLNPQPLLSALRGRLSDRKMRLFAAACCRRIWDLILRAEARDAVQAAEQFADAEITIEDLATIDLGWTVTSSARHAAARAAMPGNASHCHTAEAALAAVRAAALEYDAEDEEGEAQADLLRDIVGNPFRPVTLDTRWLTSSVIDLASTIYQHRAFDLIPILADALMDASCDNDDILEHCRSDAPHARGCWAVDLVLGKT
jgi:hypothetical protein